MELIPGLPNDIARECLIRVPYNNLSQASVVCKAWKSDIESVQFHQLRKTAGLSRTIVVLAQAEQNNVTRPKKYLSTPVYQLTLYEPATGTWERITPVPGHSNGFPLFCQCASVGHSLVVIGGWDPATASWEVSKEVHVYDFLSATWKRGADMPGSSRSFFACASDSVQMVFVAGGHDEEKNALRSAMAYEVARDEWMPLPDMAIERDECKGVFHGGKFHVIGGYTSNAQGRFGRSTEAFDLASWQWDQVKEDVLQMGLCPRTCVLDEDGNMYNFLGDHVVVSDSAKWKAVIEMPLDVRVGTSVLTWQSKMMVIGSPICSGPYCCYVLEGGKWTKAESPAGFTGHVQTGCSLEI